MGCEPPAWAGGRGDGMSECSNVTEGTAEAPSWGEDGESPSAMWGQQQGSPHGSPQTSRPWRPGRRGLDEKEACR